MIRKVRVKIRLRLILAVVGREARSPRCAHCVLRDRVRQRGRGSDACIIRRMQVIDNDIAGIAAGRHEFQRSIRNIVTRDRGICGTAGIMQIAVLVHDLEVIQQINALFWVIGRHRRGGEGRLGQNDGGEGGVGGDDNGCAGNKFNLILAVRIYMCTFDICRKHALLSTRLRTQTDLRRCGFRCQNFDIAKQLLLRSGCKAILLF